MKASQLVHDKARACVEKRSYGERTARRAARVLRHRGEEVRAYACPSCSSWHVGHEPNDWGTL